MRVLLLLAALVFALPAMAQDVPEDARRDLWCGLAFTIVAKDAPSDATPEQLAVMQRYVEGARGLIDGARQAHKDAGYSDAAFDARVAELEPQIKAQVSATDEPATYSFEECTALLGL